MESFTIEKLVNASNFHGLRLVAGKWNSENAIGSTNIIDNPDTYDWIKAGEFPLTTGYVFQNDPAEQRRLVKELSELNCAGLGIKVQRYWESTPERIIRAADKYGLPVVEIPFRYSLSEVTSYINTQIFRREATLLLRYQEAHATFIRCSLEGGGIDEIARIAAGQVRNPILITDSEWRLLSYQEHPENPKPMAEYLRLTPGDPCFPAEFTAHMPKDASRLTVSFKRHFPQDGGDIVCRFVPIASGESIYGFITVWETVNKLDSMDYVMLEMAANNCAIERIKAKQLEEAAHRQRRTFFDDLLQNRIASVSAVRSMSSIHGLDSNRSHVCAVIQVSQPENIEMEEAHRGIHRLMRLVEDCARACKQTVVTFHRMNMVILLIQVQRNTNNQRPGAEICTFLEDVDSALEDGGGNYTWSIGVSNVCQNILYLSRAYNNAVEVIHLASGMNTSRRIFYLNEMLGFHFLSGVTDKSEAAEYVKTCLGPLLEYDNRYKTQLLDTLECFFANNRSIVATGRELFIHKNSMRYRLERIQKLLNNDLEKAEDCFNLQLALHLRRLM